MPTYCPELVRIMLAHGCRRAEGGKGSHAESRNLLNGRTGSVPRSKNRHTASHVLKQLGIGKGQLYRRRGEQWVLIGGYPLSREKEKNEGG